MAMIHFRNGWRTIPLLAAVLTMAGLLDALLLDGPTARAFAWVLLLIPLLLSGFVLRRALNSSLHKPDRVDAVCQ